jgi:hypothetical protein
LTFTDKIEKTIRYKKEGLSNKKIAEKLSIAEGYVKKLWALRRLHPGFMELLKEKKLTTPRAQAFARLSLEKQEEEYKKFIKPNHNSVIKTNIDEEILKKLVLDGIVGVNLSQIIMEMPKNKRQKILDFLSNPISVDLSNDLDDEIQEKRRELKMLDQEIGCKKNSITFMNYTRDALKPLTKAEDTVKELARGGVERAYLFELTEWIGLLHRIEEIIRNVMATVQVYDMEILEKGKGDDILCQ